MVDIRTQLERLLNKQVLASLLTTIKRRLRKFKAQGLTITFSQPPDPQSEFSLPYYGWGITDETCQTEEYQKAWEAKEKILRKVFGDNVFPDGQ